ncbi:MAG TPA: DNA primase [Candidatus Udaeobacter sp.]|nr:DNA primase [Candidatus Udaeobacter sp.]
MSFTPAFLDELRQRVSLVAAVARRVRLQKRGREQLGLCPFHNEKTPSFTVSDEKGFFHCFGCGAHGDVIGFVMRSEGLGFPETVERLAREAGLPIPVATPEERARSELQATLVSALETAAAWYERQLASPAGRAALDYLHRRGLRDDTIARFRLGYAPEGRSQLRDALQRAGVSLELSIEAGLVGKGEDGALFDRMRGRVIFPIGDRRGRVIAFGGRILGDGLPKYLNSPETPLFKKGRSLYGLAQAQRAARDGGEVIVAEGYMDVIALAQGGFAQSVAPLGTALTEEQMEELWRLVPEPILCFDGDEAGMRAAARTAERAMPLLQPGKSLRFALLPPDEDPDSLILTKGPSEMRSILDRALPLAEAVWQVAIWLKELNTPERRAGLRKEIGEITSRIAERTVREAYRAEFDQRLEKLFGGNLPAKPAWGSRRRPAHQTTPGGEAVRGPVPDPLRMQGEVVLATLLNHPELIASRLEALAHFPLPAGQLDKLRQAVIDHGARQPDLDSEALKNHLSAEGFAAMLPDLLRRAGISRFTLASAPVEVASEGLDHVLGLAEERAHGKEAAVAARHLGEELTGEAQTRFEAARDLALGGESRRRDIDGSERGN